MRNLGVVILIFCSLITILPNTATSNDKEEEVWLQKVLKGKQKVAKLHFYVQDVVGGPNATVLTVAVSNVTSTSPTFFGLVSAVDDLLTEGPNRTSKEVGRIQGIIVSSDFRVFAITINLNIVFTSGQYNGSTLTVLGRNQMLDKKREMSIVGGTGVFAMARGRYIQTTYSQDPVTNYGVLEVTAYVVYF